MGQREELRLEKSQQRDKRGRGGEARPGGCARALVGTWGPFVPGVPAPRTSPHLGLCPVTASASQKDLRVTHST